jgi:hypothetical protein
MSTSINPEVQVSASAYEVKEKLAALEAALLSDTPAMPTLLRDIHRKLKSDPDVVTILTEEECAILVRGLKKQTSTNIATKAIKKGATKSLSKLSVDDL